MEEVYSYTENLITVILYISDSGNITVTSYDDAGGSAEGTFYADASDSAEELEDICITEGKFKVKVVDK